jgi:hypothetical protein
MQRESKEFWRKYCELAVKEQDPHGRELLCLGGLPYVA